MTVDTTATSKTPGTPTSSSSASSSTGALTTSANVTPSVSSSSPAAIASNTANNTSTSSSHNQSTSQQYHQSPSNTNVVKKNRADVIRTIQEITKFDEVTINQAIEACQDNEGRYSMDQVLNILMDEKSNENESRSGQSIGYNRQLGQTNDSSSSNNANEDASKYPMNKNSKSNNSLGIPHSNNFPVNAFGASSNNLDEDDLDDDFEPSNSSGSMMPLNPSSPLKTTTGLTNLSESNLLREDGKPSGLKNVGNTCWFNSIIQAFFQLPYFRQLILSFHIDQNEINKLDENSKNVVNFVIELRKLFALMLKSKRKAINPNPTLRCLRSCSKYDVDTFNQEDVSEFATILVNLIEESFDILFKMQQSQATNESNISGGASIDSNAMGVSLNINNLSKTIEPQKISSLGSGDMNEIYSNTVKLKPIGDKTTLAIATANTLANNLRKNRKNPIVNLLNGDILINRKNSDEDNTHSLIEIFREVNIQMLNSRNLHAGLELEWGETSIDKLTTSTPISTSTNTSNQTKHMNTSESSETTEVKMNKSIYEQESWIVQLPSVLFICLNRYKFVKATQSSSKILEPFEFYPFIYLDRYMFSNKELIKSKRKELKQLNNELNVLESKLNQIKEYKYSAESNATYRLDEVFKCAHHFATTDYSTNEVFNYIKSETNTTNSEMNQDESNKLNIIQQYLKNLIIKIEFKIDDLKQSINEVKQKINTIYDQDNLKKVKYNLHSVCIHEGNATSGHFWTYIWNTQHLKWYKFNDVEVSESTWEDLYANAVGGKNKNEISNKISAKDDSSLPNLVSDNNDGILTNEIKQVCKTNERMPSAYFLIYTKADDENLYKENNQLDKDLIKYINEDQEALENQLSLLKLKQLFRETNENLKKSNLLINSVNQGSSSAAANEQNNQTCIEHAKAFYDSTLDSFTASLDYILPKQLNVTAIDLASNSSGVDEALNHAIELELNKHANITARDVLNKLPDTDLRINHILTYFSCNNLSRDMKILALYDIFRIQIFPENNIKIKILQTHSQIKYNEYVLASLQPVLSSTASTSSVAVGSVMSPTNTSATVTGLNPNLIKSYEKWQADYRDFRSIIAAFINGVNFMESQKFEEAAQFFCVACEYNERITNNLAHKMKGMDHEFLLLNRRKCLKAWNQSTIRKFTQRNNLNPLNQQELTSLIETMINKFLNCFFRLAGSTSEDKAMIEEIRQDWLNVLDSNLPEISIFQDFLTKLFEDSLANHYHSLNVNKTNLLNRYKEVTNQH